MKHTCFGVTTSRVEYWEIRESPAFKANESKSRKDRCNNVTLAAEIQREGKINPSAFQVSQAKRAVAGDTRRSHKLPPVRPPSFKIRSSMNTSDFLDVVDDNLLCTICQNVMVSPSCCGQGHQFCLECISKWIEQSPTCPSCSGDLTVSSLTKLRLVENMINKLRVRCCHAGVKDGPSPGPKNLRRRSRPDVASSAADSEVAIEGCGWIGALGNRAKHLEDECMHSEVECSCEGCDAKVPRFQVAEHEASCEHRELSCAKCEERIKAGERDAHMLRCKLVEIECPQCGARVLRGDLEEHEQECANKVVSCPFADHGCEVRGERRKIREHVEEAAVAHARLMGRRDGREHERIAALEKELEEIKLREKERTAALEKELAETRRKLARAPDACGEATRVVWKIEGFTDKAKDKELGSSVFRVHTKVGEYRLRLFLDFARKAGSSKQGYCGFFVGAVAGEEDASSAPFPLGLEGTTLTVRKGERMATQTYTAEHKLDDSDDAPWAVGDHNGFRADKIAGSKWKTPDAKRGPEGDAAEPEHDVCDFLENDTLTVSGYIRVTPPSEIPI